MGKDVKARPGAGEERGTVQFGTTTIEYTVRRSRRRKKTFEISLDHGAGVVVAAPMKASLERIRQVVLKRAGWIVQKAAEKALKPHRKEFVSGESLLFLGQEARLLVEHASVRRVAVAFERGAFRITAPSGLDGEERRAAIVSAIVRWYRARAAEHLCHQVEHWSEVTGLTPRQVLVRDQRQRWGSCSRDGTLRFNLRLVMAPPAVIDYVVVHELVHLRIRNHSAAYWTEMSKIMPDCKARRTVLREMGPRLTI